MANGARAPREVSPPVWLGSLPRSQPDSHINPGCRLADAAF